MREVEDSLGVLLLNRTSRGVSPTVCGSIFKQHAEQLLLRRNMAVDELEAAKSGLQGRARIGVAPAVSGYLPGVMPPLVAQILQDVETAVGKLTHTDSLLSIFRLALSSIRNSRRDTGTVGCLFWLEIQRAR
jgi:DNA-binding transcriptional LysR family regulator